LGGTIEGQAGQLRRCRAEEEQVRIVSFELLPGHVPFEVFANDCPSLLSEGVEEHRQAKMFLRELDALQSEGERFEAKLKVLMEDIKHHVQEEEGEMFPMIKEQFDESSLQELGQQLESEKQGFQKPRKAASSR